VIAGVAAIWRAIRNGREWLTLVVVAAIGAWLYVQRAEALAERDDAVHRAEIVCARSGVEWSAPDKAGRGAACARHVAGLVAFRADVDRQTIALFTKAMADAKARTVNDNQAARLAAEAARAAAERMETADAEAERRNFVGPDWLAAVNGVAGLRPPGR